MLDNIEKNTEDQTDPFAKYGGKKVVKNEDPFAKYGGAILKKKESSQPTSQQKQQASKSQQQEQPTSSATGQQQNQQASATSDGVTKDEGNWFDKSMSYVTGIASEGVKSVFQKADDALNASKNYLKSEGFFDDGKVPDSPKSITDYFLNAADKYKDLGTKEVISNILPLKEAEIAMKIINSSMPQEQKNNVLKTINLASTKIKAGIGHIEEYQKYVLPEHNIPTNVLLGMASIAPDLIAAEVMGPASAESKLAAWGEKATENASTLVKKYAPKALKFVEEAATGNFTKIMAAEGAAKAAANTKEGENLYVNTLKGGIEGELEGMYMHGLGVASGKVMPSIAKGIARSGVNSEIATAIANPLANAGVFATAKALRTGIEEKRLLTAEELGTELGTGIGFSLLHAGSLYKNHNEINHYYDNVLNDDNLGSFSRVINETKDNLKAAYNPKLTDVDVKELTDARDELKAAILKEPDLNNKQILGDQAVKIQNQLDAHSAINGIVKEKDAIVKLIESNNEIPEEDRTRYVAKINAIADTFDMSEMAIKKREFDSKMEAAQSELDKANQEFNTAVKPSEKIAAKVKVDNARKTLDDLNTKLTTFIKEAPVAGTPDQISKPIELSVEPKPNEIKPIETVDALKDVESTAKALESLPTEERNIPLSPLDLNNEGKITWNRNDPQSIAEAYHRAKKEGSNLELVEVVEELFTTKAEAKPNDLVKEYIDSIEKVKAESPDVFWSVDRPFQNEDGTINEVELKKAAEEGRLIKTEAGFGVVGKDGDIKGVFKADLKSTEKTGDKVIQEAVKAGGTKLDNFALPNLMKIYERNGFREVSRIPFNEEYAPEGWSKEKHGTPDVVAMVYDPEGKLPIEKKNFTDYDEAIKYRDSFLEAKPEVDADLEALHKLFDESEQGGKFSDEQVENGKKAIEGIVPDVEWVIHDTNESMKSATGTTNKGEYILTRDKDGNVKREIHINKVKADGTTVAHEVFHAVLLEKVLNDADAQDLTKRMMKAVAKTASPKIKQELEDFVKTYPEYLKDEERLAQLVGILAKNYDQLSKPNKTIIKKWLDKLAKMFGLKPFTDNEVIDLLNTIAGKTARGEAITEKDIEIFKGGKKVSAPSEGLTKRFSYGNDKVNIEIKYLEQERIDELKEKGLLTEPENLSELNGKRIVTTSPDDMLVGSIYANGKEIATGNGGVHFVTKFGDVWANSDAGTANGLAKAINDAYDPETGKSYLGLVKGTDAKLVSSPQGVTSSLAITESMLDAGLFSLSDFRSAVRSAVKSSGGDIKLTPNGSAKVLKAEVDNFFKDVTSSTFEKRGNVLREIVSNLAKSESAKNNKTEIIKFLDGNENKRLGATSDENRQSLIDLIAKTSAEKLTKGLNTGDIYAVIQIDGKVKVFKDEHQSYPYHIRIVDENGNVSTKKPVLILPKNRRNGKEILTSLDGKTAEELGSKTFAGAVGATANMPHGKGIIMDDSVSITKRSQKSDEDIKVKESETEKVISVYHGAPKGKDVTKISDKGVKFFATDKREADEYARMNSGVTQEFLIKESDVVNEDVVIKKIKELGLTPNNKEFEVDDASLYELIDTRFDESLSKNDIKKLFDALKKEGIKAISYSDGAQVSGKLTTSIAVIDPSIVSDPFISKETKRSQNDGEKLIDDYVRISRNNNFSDATIKRFLKSKGFSDADIDVALAPKEKSKNFVKSFFSEDVVPRFKSTAEAVYETSKAVVNALSPKTGVNKGVVTKFYELTGDRNKSNTFVDKIVGEYEKTFDKMTTVDRVEFVDRMKAGKAQATPELDVIAKVISRLDKDLYDEITKYSPNLAWKENHFRVLWKKVPGKDKEKFWSFLSKRPLRGTQGFFKQSTLSSMTEGIAKGGEPHSTNPITMFKLAYDDSMKFITSQRIITALKKDGVIKFVKSGEDVPEGFTKINDNVANVYFKSDSGMVKTGEYYIQEGPGRMLNNMLSRDMIRDTKAGKSLMDIKNLYTQVELSLSPFHAVAITLEQIASGAGIGFRKIVNLGDVKGGIKDILTAPFSPKNTFSLGRKFLKFSTVKDFENSKEGKELLRRMPEAAQYVDDFFKGGGLMKQHEDLKANTYKALKENMGKNNYIGATLRALPAINEGIMDPLFNVYIPSLKIGLFMKEFPLILAENKSRLDKGTTTREKLSRDVIDSIDNRLGEMNFDNLYWNKTFKTSMQFMLRSVTWKLGNIRQMGGAAPEQAIEFYNAIKEKRRPNLSPKMAWLFGLSLTQVVLSSIIQGMSLDDDDKNKDIKDFKDIVAPRINSADDKERVVIPTYYKDLLHFWHAPTEYVSSGVSGPFGKGLELYKNKDFYGYEIYDETDPKYKQLFDAAKHSAPEPFSISSFKKMRDKGEPVSKQALSFLGFNKAPGYLEHSDLESEIIDLYRIRNTSVKPLKMKEANDKKKEIRDMYKKDIEKAQEMADEAVNSGLLRPTQVSRLFRDVAKNEDAIVYFFQRLPETDKEYIYSKMTKEEKAKFDPKNKLGQSTEASVEGVYE